MDSKKMCADARENMEKLKALSAKAMDNKSEEGDDEKAIESLMALVEFLVESQLSIVEALQAQSDKIESIGKRPAGMGPL